MTANDTAAASYQLRRKEREADTALLRQALEALEGQQDFWYSLPSGVDEEAQIDNDSPEDAAAHVAGLAVKAAQPIIVALAERLLQE